MANAINDAHIEGKFGADALDKIISQLQDTVVKNIYEGVKKKAQADNTYTKRVRERLLTTKTGSEADQAALLYDLAQLKGSEAELQKEIIESTDKEEQQDLQRRLMDVQNEMMDNALANRYIGRSASNLFRLRQLWVNRESSVVDMVEQYKAANGIKELTPEQEQHVKEKYNIIQEARVKERAAKEQLQKAQEENAKLKEENKKLEELKGKASNQKKADRKTKDEEAIKKSNERIQKSKDALKALIDETKNVGIQPKVNPFLAPKMVAEISKIAAEKVYQGTVKFTELVQDVLDEIKSVLPHWTEKDVVNHLLSEKDKSGNYIPSLTSERYLKSKTLLDKSDKTLNEKAKAYMQAGQIS